MKDELGGDRAVIIVSALVALSSSTSVSKDNIDSEECLCRDNLFFRAHQKLLQLLNGEMSWKEKSYLQHCGHISG